MSYKPLIALAVSLGLATPAAAAMSVGTFLAKAAPLRANPFTALTNNVQACLNGAKSAAQAMADTQAEADRILRPFKKG